MRLLCLSLLLGLPACAIIGFPSDPTETDGATSTSGPEQTSTTGGSEGTGSTAGSESTTDGSTTEAAPTTGVTTGGLACDGLDELTCNTTAGCRAVLGTALEFPGCTSLPAYLGCIEQTDCGLMPTTVCRNGSLEVYVLDDTCVPPDFMACDSMLPQCGDACLGLDEAACSMNPDCVAHFGAPHVEQDQMVCADFGALQFLACDKQHDPCPPAVIAVCPFGQPDVAFDVASGCVPPGFEACMDGPAPECP